MRICVMLTMLLALSFAVACRFEQRHARNDLKQINDRIVERVVTAIDRLVDNKELVEGLRIRSFKYKHYRSIKQNGTVYILDNDWELIAEDGDGVAVAISRGILESNTNRLMAYFVTIEISTGLVVKVKTGPKLVDY